MSAPFPETSGALAASGLSIDVSKRRILTGVDFTCARGALVGVLGANGAGKSTLLRALCGLLPAAGGSVLVGGAPVASLRAEDRARRIALVPQQAECAWPVPCRMIVELGRLPHTGAEGSGSAEDRMAVDEAMEAMGVADLADRPATRISGGELKRVLIARALATRPDYLLLDEPTAALDPYHQLHLMELLRAQSRTGRGVVATLHDLTLAARYCDEVLVLDHGTVAASGSARDALSPAILRGCYGIEARIEWHGGEPVLHSRLPGAESRGQA